MPADYSSTAKALLSASPSPRPSPSLSPSASPTPSPTTTTPPTPALDAPVPPWVRSSPQRPGSGTTNARRLSTPYSRTSAHDNGAPLGRRIVSTSLGVLNKIVQLFRSLTPLQRALAVAGLVAVNVLLVVFLVYSHRIFAALGPVAQGWRALPGGWALVALMTMATAFPPMIGYSTCVTVAGFVYGFPGGWPVVAGATVVGSTGAFVASRTVLSGYVHALVGGDRRFVALGQVLRHDGLPVLAAIRFCPLPFSLSNGFLATIPSVSPLSFAVATALATPKLLVHVFIGSRLALLAESGDDMSVGDRAVNYLSMILGSLVGMGVGLFIYRRTMARAKELAREEAAGNGVALSSGDDDGEDLNYEDLEEGVLGLGLGGGGRSGAPRSDEAEDAAALMGDDDISLWETEVVEDAYRDEEAETTEGTTTNGVANGKCSRDNLK
ncbi:hypothetical protein F5B20DRAFT_488454 [Whalleya microplaca]|nr:hypothetical protein F5B20DRAFT_488454 [Whalleya microplaca]